MSKSNSTETINKKKYSILFIAPKLMSQTTKLLIEEAGKLFKKVDVVDINSIILGAKNNNLILKNGKIINIFDYDYIFPKIDGKRKDFGFQIINILDSTELLKPYTSATVLVAHDKFLTSVVLNQHNIKTPNTYLVKSKESLQKLLKEIKFPIMMKLISGSGGTGIMYIQNKEVLESIFESLNYLNQQILIQEFIDNPGEDIRVIVAGNEIIGAYKRVAKKGEKRANIKLGGKAVKYDINEEIKQIAIKVARVIRADICAIDLLEGKDGYYVIEVNINPGIRGMMEATELNIAKRIIDYIYNKIEISKL